MSFPVLTNLDLNNNQLLNAGLQQLASDPGSPFEGQIWENTTSHEVKAYLNATVVVLQSGPITSADIQDGTIVDADIAAGAAIANTKLATNPLARANHTGTQLAATISDFDTQVRTSRLDQMAAPTASVPFNSQKITGLLDPTGPQDGATKNYVDTAVQGFKKHSVRAATTANITIATALNNADVIDGVTLAAGDQVLVKDQTTTSQNGIYTVGVTPARDPDMDTAAEVDGALVIVEDGTQAGSAWITVSEVTTIDTDPIVFTAFNKATDLVAGAGLTLTGLTLDVIVDGSSIEIVTDTLRVKAGGITNAMLAGSIDLTTKVTGLLPIANGGTNASTAAAARANLGTSGKFAGDITGNGSATQFTVTHNLGTTDVVVQVFDVTNDLLVLTDVKRPTTNTVRIDFAAAVANAKVYRVVVVG